MSHFVTAFSFLYTGLFTAAPLLNCSQSLQNKVMFLMASSCHSSFAEPPPGFALQAPTERMTPQANAPVTIVLIKFFML